MFGLFCLRRCMENEEKQAELAEDVRRNIFGVVHGICSYVVCSCCRKNYL